MLSLTRLISRLFGRGGSSVFRKLLVSNMLILLLPALLGIFLYIKMDRVMERNAERSNTAMLEQLRLSMDGKLREVEYLTQQIALNPKLDFLLNVSGAEGGELYSFVQFMQDYINRYRALLSGFVYDYYLYFQASDTILKPGVKTDSRTFFEKYYRLEGGDYAHWRSTYLSGYHNMVYFPSIKLLNSRGGEGSQVQDSESVHVLPLVQSLPLRSATDATGSLVVLIDESEIKEMFRQIEAANRSSMFIVDPDNRILSGPADLKPPESFFERLEGETGIFRYTLDHAEYMVSYTSSKRSDWRIISVLPMDVYMKPLTDMKTWTVWLFLLFISVGVLVSFTIAYRNYSPLKRTVNAIMQGKRLSGRPESNEYDLIRQTIEGSLSEERHLRGRLSQQTPVIRAHYLSRLLHGDADAEPEASLSFMNIEFVSDRFAVMLIQIDDMTGFTAEQSEKQWAFVRFIVANVGADAAQALHHGYAVELVGYRDRVALLINFRPARAEAAEADLREIAETLKDVIEKRFKLGITVAVGSVHVGSGGIGSSHMEALAALSYTLIKGKSAIIFFDETKDAKQHYHYPIETEVRLVNYVKSGDVDNVLKLLDDIYALNFEAGAMTPELGQCLFINITSTFLKIVNSSNAAFRDILGQEPDPLKIISSNLTAEEMMEETKRIFELLARYLHAERSDPSVRLLQDIQAFIRSNPGDPELGLVRIADHFRMTPQYVSSYFKKASGQNITDFITRARIDKAKMIIESESKELTNAQIAQRVGYANDVVFIRVFKKLEGITPGKYRELVQSEGDE